MFALVLLTISLTVPLAPKEPIVLVPGDGLGLASVPPAVTPLSPGDQPRGSEPSRPPWGYGGTAGSGLAAGAALLALRKRRRRSEDAVFVLVHGNGGSAADFDELLASLGVEPADAVAFDYRAVVEAESSTEASKIAQADAAAAELDEFIRGLARDHANIYSLHHSKGGAIGAAMIGALDDGTNDRIDSYRGAALLDPAIASGFLGSLQRAGRISTLIPDNGGFDPVQCSVDGCKDVREHLGEASGVEVIAIRNPDAVITNFTDEPAGLRVYDLVDDGRSSALWAPFGIIGFQRRVSEAHGSVLSHAAVADCVKAEVARAGSCVWKGNSATLWPVWGSGGGRNSLK